MLGAGGARRRRGAALTGRIVDVTNTLSSSDIAAQSSRLQDLQRRKGSQIAVLIVPTTAPETIEQFSIRAAEAWKIGRKKIDDGALLVIAKDDHKLRIEVGNGLEGAMTDVTARRIIDETIVPRFKSGDFSGGIAAGLTRMIGVIDGEPLPAPAPEVSHGGNDILISFLNPFNPFTLFFLFAVGAITRSLLGRLLGSVDHRRPDGLVHLVHARVDRRCGIGGSGCFRSHVLCRRPHRGEQQFSAHAPRQRRLVGRLQFRLERRRRQLVERQLKFWLELQRQRFQRRGRQLFWRRRLGELVVG